MPRGPGPNRARRRARGSADTPAPIGSEVAPARRERVYLRDELACVRCGGRLPIGYRQLQHRVPRQAGGRLGHDAYSHLLLLCGFSSNDPDGCHYHCERWRIDAQAGGYLVPEGEDPREWPVRYSEFHGGGLWLLDDDGDRVRIG